MISQFLCTEKVFFLCFTFLIIGSCASLVESSTEVAKTGCGDLGDCISETKVHCHKICGCDRFAAFHYNETTGECQVSFKHLMVAVVKKYGNEEDGLLVEDEMGKTIRIEAEKIFQAILISVIIFMTSCAVCVTAACFYCCRINYTDYRLQNDMKALAKKLNRKGIVKKAEIKTQPAPVAQSCNIICKDAGVFVV